MTRYRDALPQLADEVFLADSGVETDLIYNVGIDLPEFAAFPLLDDGAGRNALQHYYAQHLAVASDAGRGIILEAVTWRASERWGARLGYHEAALARVNVAAVALLTEMRMEVPAPVVLSAAIGPQDDGGPSSTYLSADQARRYHEPQLKTLASTGVDMAHAMTIAYVDEAIGMTAAAQAAGLPVAVSWTVETDGSLPDGTPLADAIHRTDDATEAGPVYYGINCAHPTHFASVLREGEDWMARLRCIRANASAKSHAELDEADGLDAGDPQELAMLYARLRERHPGLTVLGGCCGTDARHIRAIAATCIS